MSDNGNPVCFDPSIYLPVRYPHAPHSDCSEPARCGEVRDDNRRVDKAGTTKFEKAKNAPPAIAAASTPPPKHRAWGRQPASTPDVFDLPHDYYSDQYALLRHGGGRETRVVCGGTRLEHPAARHLIDALPALTHPEASQSTRAGLMRSALGLMAEDPQHPPWR